MILGASVTYVRNGKGRQHFNVRRYISSVYFPCIVQENCENETVVTDSEREVFFSSCFNIHMEQSLQDLDFNL